MYCICNCSYPYNNFLHHHVDDILLSCLESKNASLIKHLLHDCDLVGKILEAEKNCMLTASPDKVISDLFQSFSFLVAA